MNSGRNAVLKGHDPAFVYNLPTRTYARQDVENLSELITAVVAVLAVLASVASALASWRSATAARASAAIAKATRQPFVDVIEWFNITLEVFEPPTLPYPRDQPRTPDKLTICGRIQELAGIPTRVHRARIRYSPGIAKPGEFRDTKFITGIDSIIFAYVLFKERVPALISEEFDVRMAEHSMEFRPLPTNVGRVELELTISVLNDNEVYVWTIESLVFYHGVKNGAHRVDLRSLPPALVSKKENGSRQY